MMTSAIVQPIALITARVLKLESLERKNVFSVSVIIKMACIQCECNHKSEMKIHAHTLLYIT